MPILPRRTPPTPPSLGTVVEHARILRGAGDLPGAARLLDDAFAVEARGSEPLRRRALLLRAQVAFEQHDDAAAARFLDVADALGPLADALAALDVADARRSSHRG